MGLRILSASSMSLPRHVAIIMDGNGRWAAARGLPRSAGHKAGIPPIRMCIEQCTKRGIAALTLFAFSSENWNRPRDEVMGIMTLFVDALDREIAELHANGVRLRFIGDRTTLAVRLQSRIAASEAQTAGNAGLQLNIAISYGGRWDLVVAAQRLASKCSDGTLRPAEIDEARFAGELQLAGIPDPDLFIRTGGERRISNFLLWNLAYTELCFLDSLWPEFDETQLDAALEDYSRRQRRYGLTGAQVEDNARA